MIIFLYLLFDHIIKIHLTNVSNQKTIFVPKKTSARVEKDFFIDRVEYGREILFIANLRH